jgi:hypothetical protein
MNHISVYIILLVFGFCMPVYAQQTGWAVPMQTSHHIPGIKIVSRQQWGADESLKYSSQKAYQAILASKAKNAEYIKKLEALKSPKLIAIRKNQAKTQEANAYLKTTFPLERFPLQTITYEMWNTLRWPFAYQKKTKFIIHHTVTDTSKLNTQQDVYAYLQKVQKLHSVTRGRWDIWYNYLIWPDGTIYEWRAGWELVIGAHATRNNYQAIGIALIGNFENESVPVVQVESLIKLISQLALKYDINPKQSKIYHKESKQSPYISDISMPGIIWHKHVGNTQCPGRNLLDQLEYIRHRVYANLKLTTGAFVTPLYDISRSGSTIVIDDILSTPVPSQCVIDDSSVQLIQCRYEWSKLTIDLQALPSAPTKKIQYASIILKYSNRDSESIMLWYRILPSIQEQLQTLKTSYTTTHNIKAPSKYIAKVPWSITQSDIPVLSRREVSVLLYNTTLVSKHSIICDQWCQFTDHHGQTLTLTWVITINKSDSLITGTYHKQNYQWSALQIKPIGKRINITNTDGTRAYVWTLTMKQWMMKHLDGREVNTILITNQLPFKDYLYGIAEENDAQHIEKLKTLAILVKNYALFYLHPLHKHNSVILWQGYDFIDDPRIFQKYIWYNFQKNNPLWVRTVDDTRDQRVLYNDKLVILPYYHCHAGFTRSAREKFGWTDTPYLTSIRDPFGACANGVFQWHGVWLSGVWASKHAQQWSSHTDLIKYYYPGTRILYLDTP